MFQIGEMSAPTLNEQLINLRFRTCCQEWQFPSAINLSRVEACLVSKRRLSAMPKCAWMRVLNSTKTAGVYAVVMVATILFVATAALAQMGSEGPTTNVAFWVDRWSRTPVIVFGHQEEAFYSNIQVILFPWNDHDDPSNPEGLDNDILWLKEHPQVRFYIDGYASSRGGWLYNIALSQRRTDWVKQRLVDQGIAESRIKGNVGWGELYPVCPESNDECWSKNRLVRLVYSPD